MSYEMSAFHIAIYSKYLSSAQDTGGGALTQNAKSTPVALAARQFPARSPRTVLKSGMPQSGHGAGRRTCCFVQQRRRQRAARLAQQALRLAPQRTPRAPIRVFAFGVWGRD